MEERLKLLEASNDDGTANPNSLGLPSELLMQLKAEKAARAN